jgi:hypothetical protein
MGSNERVESRARGMARRLIRVIEISFRGQRKLQRTQKLRQEGYAE